MLGREAYHCSPNCTTRFTRKSPRSRRAKSLLDRMGRYAERALARGDRLSSIARHMLGLYGGEPGAREYRRTLSEGARVPEAGPELFRRAIPSVARSL